MCRSARSSFFSAQIKNRDFAGPDTDHVLISVAPAARLDIGAVDAAVAGRQIPLNAVQHCARFQIIMIPHIGVLMRGGIAMVKHNRTRSESRQGRCPARQQPVQRLAHELGAAASFRQAQRQPDCHRTVFLYGQFVAVRNAALVRSSMDISSSLLFWFENAKIITA